MFNIYNEDGLIVETRLYQDSFPDHHSEYIIRDDVMTLSDSVEPEDVLYTLDDDFTIEIIGEEEVTEVTASQEFTISTDLSNYYSIVNPTQINWDIARWGLDNVPIKFDTMKAQMIFQKIAPNLL